MDLRSVEPERPPEETSSAGREVAVGDRRGLRSSLLVGGLVGLGVLIGGIAGYLLHRTADVASRRAAPPIVERLDRGSLPLERQIAQRRLAEFRVPETAFQAMSAGAVAVEGFSAPIELSPPFDIVDSTVFETADQRIRLAWVQPIGRGEVCVDGNGLRFACGLMGRAALISAIGGRSVVCRRLFMGDFLKLGQIDAECRTETGDLAMELVHRGFAVPLPEAEGRFEEVLSTARAERVGIWAGPWIGSGRDPSVDDMRALPIGWARKTGIGFPPAASEPDEAAPTAVQPEPPPVRSVDAAPAKPAKAAPKRKRQPASSPPPERIPTLDELAPNRTKQSVSGVVAGPILPLTPRSAARPGAASGGPDRSPGPRDVTTSAP